MHLCDHSALLHPCKYVFLCAKPPWQPLDRFRLSHQKFGMHCRVIFRPSQLFLLSEELSNTIFSCLHILTVGHLVASRHLNVSLFVIRHHLLPSCWWKIPCRPAKRAPSERLRLVKVVKPTYRLHFGARVNAALLTYLLVNLRETARNEFLDLKNVGNKEFTQSSVPTSTCETGSWPEFSRSPEHGSFVKLRETDSLTSKT